MKINEVAAAAEDRVHWKGIHSCSCFSGKVNKHFEHERNIQILDGNLRE